MSKQKRILLSCLTLIFCMASYVAKAQDMVVTDHDSKRVSSNIDRFYLGPVPIIAFGNGFTNLGLSVEAGYMLNENISIGGRPTISYRREKYTDSWTGIHYDQASTFYGMSIFSRVYITESIFALAEYEWVNYGANVLINNSFYRYDRIDVDGLFIGGGYRQMMNNTYWHVLLRYNLTQGEYSPFINPDIQFGWGFFF